MFEQKHLLKNDTELALLTKQNMSLREALVRAKDSSIALGLVIENWSAYPLSTPELKINLGTVLKNNFTLPEPSGVPAGTVDVGVILQSKALTGTNGIIRYTLGSTDLVLSIMWTVPYNRQLWRSWVAVGLSSRANQPSYK